PSTLSVSPGERPILVSSSAWVSASGVMVTCLSGAKLFSATRLVTIFVVLAGGMGRCEWLSQRMVRLSTSTRMPVQAIIPSAAAPGWRAVSSLNTTGSTRMSSPPAVGGAGGGGGGGGGAGVGVGAGAGCSVGVGRAVRVADGDRRSVAAMASANAVGALDLDSDEEARLIDCRALAVGKRTPSAETSTATPRATRAGRCLGMGGTAGGRGWLRRASCSQGARPRRSRRCNRTRKKVGAGGTFASPRTVFSRSGVGCAPTRQPPPVKATYHRYCALLFSTTHPHARRNARRHPRCQQPHRGHLL